MIIIAYTYVADNFCIENGSCLFMLIRPTVFVLKMVRAYIGLFACFFFFFSDNGSCLNLLIRPTVFVLKITCAFLSVRQSLNI